MPTLEDRVHTVSQTIAELTPYLLGKEPTRVMHHCPLGPISLAAGIQLDASISNFLCQEQVHLGEGDLKQPFAVKKGHIDLLNAPGLGIEFR